MITKEKEIKQLDTGDFHWCYKSDYKKMCVDMEYKCWNCSLYLITGCKALKGLEEKVVLKTD